MNNLFMQRAIKLSLENIKTGAGGPFGVVIVKNNMIIAEGTNLVTSSNDPTAHAEIIAIRAACKKLKIFHLPYCQIYTSCEPCSMCLSAIYWSRIQSIYYANTKEDAAKIKFDDSLIYNQLALSKEKRSIEMKQIMRNEALKVFDLWQEKIDTISY